MLTTRRGPQRVDGHHADDADAHAGGIDDHRRPDIRPVDHAARRVVDQIGGQHRIFRARGDRFEGAARIVVRRTATAVDVHGSEIEFVISDGCRRVAHCGIGIHDDARLHSDSIRSRPDRGIAGVDEEHGPAIGSAGVAEVPDVAAEDRQASAAVALERETMQIGRADDGQR